jgi:hypothetical protein
MLLTGCEMYVHYRGSLMCRPQLGENCLEIK